MKILLVLFLIFSSFVTATAQEGGCDRAKAESDFYLGLDFQSKYVWRGQEMITQESSPVVFPSLGYGKNDFYAYVMGGYSLNGIYSEIDLGVSYTYKGIILGINDYYYPTTTIADDNYFDFGKNTTGHWLEAALTIAPESIPAYVVLSNFFYGADKNLDGRQAYSTYVELGAHYDFLAGERLALAVGAALNESCYNNYEQGFGICNVELKYTHTLQFSNEWSLPLNVSYIINPIREKAFVNFSTSFAF